MSNVNSKKPFGRQVTSVRLENPVTGEVTQLPIKPSQNLSQEELDPILSRRIASPDFNVSVGDVNLADRGLLRLIQSITVEEHEDKADFAKVVFRNEDSKFTNEMLFAEGKFMSVSTGYKIPFRLIERGRYIIEKPTFRFSTIGKSIELIGYGEEIRLAESERRRLWTNVTDSDIAIQMAEDYGLEKNIEETSITYPQLIQAGVTDWEFLRTRASINGFQLFTRNGVLNFHAISPSPTDLELRLEGQDPNIISFDVEVDSYRGSPTIIATRVDPFSASTISAKTSFEPDGLFPSQNRGSLSNRLRNAQTLTGGPVEFLFPNVTRDDPSAILREAQAAADANQFIVRARSTTTAVETTRPGDVVTVVGVGRFEGEYVVRSVVHTITVANGYKMMLSLRRTFTGDLEEIADGDAAVTRSSSSEITNQSNLSTVVVNGRTIELGAIDPITGNRSKRALSPEERRILTAQNIKLEGLPDNQGKVRGISTSKTQKFDNEGAITFGSRDLAQQEKEDKKNPEKLRRNFRQSVFDIIPPEEVKG